MSFSSLWGSLPVRGTEIAGHWDQLYIFLFYLSVFFFLLVTGAMLLFAVKYRKGTGGQTSGIHENVKLEILWTVIPTVLVMGIFVWGYHVFHQMIQAPAGAMEVRVIARQWSWLFVYDDGRRSTDLYVPVNVPVKLIMSSEDVLHSFFVPDFRVKQDVVPGRYTNLWFQATISGEHPIFCAEFCGAAHSAMLSKVVALNDVEWKAWKQQKENSGQTGGGGDPILKGKRLTELKGCVGCHSGDGSKRIGPTYKGLYGSEKEFSDGSKGVADETYLKESIENPQAKIVKGYEGINMPTFKGQFSEEEFMALMAYFKSLK